eukprot:scaffold47370_cov71-Cyclotella_meneghiniana.AAC.2
MKSSISSVILLSISSSALAANNGSTLLRGAPAIEGSIKDEVERGSNKEQYLLPVVDAFHDWEEWEDDEKGPSEEKPPLFGANFPETVSPDSRCRTGGQPCNYLGPCCSEFSCEWTRVSMRTKYCVPFTQNESLVEIEPEPEKRPSVYRMGMAVLLTLTAATGDYASISVQVYCIVSLCTVRKLSEVETSLLDL